MSYYEKYLKYKNKYLQLNHNLQQKGGADINDNVYDNSHKYLGFITDKKEDLYICNTHDNKEFILKSSGEGKLWNSKKQEKDENAVLINLELSTSTGIDKIYQIVNVANPSDVLEIRGDAPLKPIKDNSFRLYITFHEMYLFINRLPNESSSGYYNLFFDEKLYQLVKLNDNIYLVNDDLKYTVKLILTLPKSDESDNIKIINFTDRPTRTNEPFAMNILTKKQAQVDTNAQIKRITIINEYPKDLSIKKI